MIKNVPFSIGSNVTCKTYDLSCLTKKQKFKKYVLIKFDKTAINLNKKDSHWINK